MPNDWIVVLEFEVGPGGAVGIPELERVLHALGDVGAVALVAPDRYAVQLSVLGETCGDALRDACSQWSDAARDAGLPASNVVRAEVLTASEFERERQGPA